MSTTLNSTDSTRGTPAPSSANSAGSNATPGVAALHKQSPRHDVVAWLQEKLAVEQLETGGDYSAAELAYRRGHNARGEALLRDLQLYVGLAELAACDVDGGR